MNNRTPIYLFLLSGLLFFVSCNQNGEESLVITGSSTVAPVIAEAAKRYEESNPGVRIDVQTGGSSRGIADSKSGLADLGMVSRSLKDTEKGLMTHQIAVDGVGLIVHSDNPVKGLNRDQVMQIYRKEVTNWKQFGGNDAPITVVNKADGTGTLEVFLKYTKLDSADIEADVIVGSNQQAIKTIAGNANSIGYVSIGAATSEKDAGTSIRLLHSDGVVPSTQTVAAGGFPITRPLMLVDKGSDSKLVTDFLDYLKSEKIEDIIESHLYVPASN